MPLRFRVSGHIGTMCPIIMRSLKLRWLLVASPQLAYIIMRGDYYVVPPNSAHVGRCVRESLACAHASGPDAKQKARPSPERLTTTRLSFMLHSKLTSKSSQSFLMSNHVST